jgi:hypothetical protein
MGYMCRFIGYESDRPGYNHADKTTKKLKVAAATITTTVFCLSRIYQTNNSRTNVGIVRYFDKLNNLEIARKDLRLVKHTIKLCG